ncbi:peptidyl-prolyl cis-trans isomerase, putative [Plasmodium vivax]|uniref:Cyclophilin, putative n=6 Tax=Plasmodium vivax TaxID=5855 RepID=A5K727_PLAVS|nr:cyclophilin, putative [Plasmodium vivax]KMZ81139.1 cyclophilin [Plasmodium vivax India VII]KMZ87258.1 cyclophilin [Plasmodium vivax Brazil I]KMZ93814.1 cyclophilin [Plasmodium vivax Mauritania I]KNA00239.1 cyclophilin [Plasmodium vivax North Korean]EDL45118.1 cyclophilin, putative [Plasmodium vivax]|eukprot:XP_001614845.1 cyclophilin [Plasmodium vivax Sal-1]
MGKHKHSKDKLYILQSEYRRDALIKKQHKSRNSTFLPFNYCCISLRPFSDPYCDEDGRLYDKKSVLEEMAKGKDERKKEEPTIDLKNLIKANFYKHNNEYICPVTRKYFNQHSKIILNKKTGNVYSSEIYKLFQNKKDMFDPITHDPMEKTDLIVLQDPLQKGTKSSEVSQKSVQARKIKAQSIQDNGAIMSILHEVQKQKGDIKSGQDKCEDAHMGKHHLGKKGDKKDTTMGEEGIDGTQVEKPDDGYLFSPNCADPDDQEDNSENEIKIKCENYSDNKLAQSVTSTISNVTYQHSFIYLPENQVQDMIYEQVRKNKKNSYVRLITDVGMINVELYASALPKLCHNFLFLSEYKYYDKTDIFKKDKREDIVYFGSCKSNYHLAASGFYWRKKLKKKKMRNKINDEKAMRALKESIMAVRSDDDSDVAIKYVRHSGHKPPSEKSCFGNVYLFRYYNQMYSNMFYICLAEDYTTGDACVGKVVGGNETLGKLKNIDPAASSEHTLNEVIIYTNPFKDVVKEMKANMRKKEEEKSGREINTESYIDDGKYVQNKNDTIGKYIKWNDFKKSAAAATNAAASPTHAANTSEELSKPKLNPLKKETHAKSKQSSRMDFSCW